MTDYCAQAEIQKLTNRLEKLEAQVFTATTTIIHSPLDDPLLQQAADYYAKLQKAQEETK